MDKYEFNLKIEQLKKLINEEDYLTALKIVESIDWNRVRNTNLLTTAANVYERNGLLQEAKDMLILAFERAPVGKHILFKLTELSCGTGDLEEAEDYYHEFRAADSTDIGNYILQYMILKARHAPYERQLLPLERYCELDPDEKWLYELATVYEYANRTDDCIRACDRLALLYGGSGYGLKALRLKSRYANLTDAQRNILYPRSVPVSAEEDGSGYADGSTQYEGSTEYTMDSASGSNAAGNIAVNDAAGNDFPEQNGAEYARSEGYSRGASQLPGEAYSAGRADARQEPRQTGVYDDRDYNADTKRITIPVYTEEAEQVQDNTELDARMSDALAAERYAGEDEAFNAYVRVCASDEGRPAAARVEVVNGTPNVQSQPQPAEDEGVQLSFDFGGDVPRVVDESYVPANGESSSQNVPEVPNDEARQAAVQDAAENMAEAATVTSSAAQHAAQAAQNSQVMQAAGTEAAAAAAVITAQTAVNTTGAMVQATQNIHQAAVNVQTAQNRQPQMSAQMQSSAAEKLSQQAAQSPLGQGLAQQQTQRPLVPHQQLKSATPVRGLHMIVEAATAADGLSIAIDELKNIHEEKGIEHASVKTSAEKLNKNGISEAIISKVSGKDFVIEHAGALSEENIDIIYRFICSDKTGTIVVLIDTPDGLDRIEELAPKLFDICDYISDIDDEEETAVQTEQRVENGVSSRQTHPGADKDDSTEEAPYDDASGDDEPYDESTYAAYDEETYTEADTAYSKTASTEQADRRLPDAPDIAEDRTPAPVKRSNGKVTAERINNVREVSPKQAGQQMEIDDFAQYCVQYAASIDCSITGTSMLALYERIELMEENDIPLTKTNAEQLIEEAADRAEKPPIGKRITGLFKSKYDKNGLLILKEDDFIY